MQKLYVIFDLVAEAFLPPIMVNRSDAPLIRHFYDLLANPDSFFSRHPNDYDLRCIGRIDDEGSIDAFGTPVIVTTGYIWSASNSPKDAPNA